MPFALLVIGLLLVVAGYRNTLPQLGSALAKDFSGTNNFFFWMAGIGAVGALGYIPKLETFSRLFIGLLIVVMALRNGGFFNQFENALATAQAPASASAAPASVAPTTGSSIGTYYDNLSKTFSTLGLGALP